MLNLSLEPEEVDFLLNIIKQTTVGPGPGLTNIEAMRLLISIHDKLESAKEGTTNA